MDSFDKNINNKFENEKAGSIPSDYSWENMAPGIMDKMPENKPKRRFLWFWLLGTGVFVLGLATTLIILNKEVSTEKNITVKNTEETNTPKDQKITGILDINETSKTDIEGSISNDEALVTEIIEVESPNNKSFEPKRSINTIETNTIREEFTTTKVTSDKISSNNEFQVVQTNNNEEIITKVEVVEINKLNKTIINNLFTIDHYLVTQEFNNININEYLLERTVKNANDSPKNLPKGFKASLLASGGVSAGFGKHNNASSLDAHRSNYFGYNIGIDALLQKNKDSKWFYSVGYKNTVLVSKFEFRNDDFVNHTIDNALVSINTNSLTGAISETRMDTTVQASRVRDVIYYNTLNMHNVSIGVGRHFALNDNITLTARAKTNYLLAMNVDAVFLDEGGELVKPDQAKDLYNKNKMSLGLNLGLQYRISERIFINTNLEIEKYVSNWSKSTSFDYHPLVGSANLGIKYNF